MTILSTSKPLGDISNFIGCMILDTLSEILNQISVKRLCQKVELKEEPVTVFYTRKVDLSVMVFSIPFWQPTVQNTYTLNKATTWTKKCALKNVAGKKLRDLKLSSIQQQYVSTTEKFVSSDVLFKEVNHSQSTKLLHVMLLGAHLIHCLRCLSFETMLCEALLFRTLFFFSQIDVQNTSTFSTFTTRNKTSACPVASKRAFLTVFTWWLNSLMTSSKCRFWTKKFYAEDGFQYTLLVPVSMCKYCCENWRFFERAPSSKRLSTNTFMKELNYVFLEKTLFHYPAKWQLFGLFVEWKLETEYCSKKSFKVFCYFRFLMNKASEKKRILNSRRKVQ